MTILQDNVYPKDLTMSMESNHIEGEITTFSDPADRMFVPSGGPFYAESVILRDANGTLLRPELDYKLLYLNETATVESGRDVVTVIWILSETITSISIDYRVVGGEYGNTVYAILQELKSAGPIQKNVDWHINVYNKPSRFPAAPHYHTPETFTDWEMIYKQLEGIRTAIQGGDLPAWQAHYNYIRSLFGNLNTGDYYTKEEVDDMLNNSMLNQILEMLKEVKECACNGSGNNGGGGGNTNRETFNIASRIEGNEIVYTLTSSDPTSNAGAGYVINEYPSSDAEDIRLTVERAGDSIIVTLASNIPSSNARYTVLITESKPSDDGAYYIVTNTRRVGVTLSNGEGKATYTLKEPKPAKANALKAMLEVDPSVVGSLVIN